MAVSDTDLTTSEGVKKLIDELSAREEVLLLASQQNVEGSRDFPIKLVGNLSDYEEFNLGILSSPSFTEMKTGTYTVSASGTSASLPGSASVRASDNGDGSFSIIFKGSYGNTYFTVSRITGKRAGGGGSALADLLALLGVVA